MISHERTARILAAELSEKGEEDWQRCVALARRISTRMEDDFRRMFRWNMEQGQTMTSHERTARILAAELSEKGEEDWRRYLVLACQIGTRMEEDIHRMFGRPEANR